MSKRIRSFWSLALISGLSLSQAQAREFQMNRIPAERNIEYLKAIRSALHDSHMLCVTVAGGVYRFPSTSLEISKLNIWVNSAGLQPAIIVTSGTENDPTKLETGSKQLRWDLTTDVEHAKVVALKIQDRVVVETQSLSDLNFVKKWESASAECFNVRDAFVIKESENPWPPAE